MARSHFEMIAVHMHLNTCIFIYLPRPNEYMVFVKIADPVAVLGTATADFEQRYTNITLQQTPCPPSKF